MSRSRRVDAVDADPFDEALAAIPGLAEANAALARASDGEAPPSTLLPKSEFERQRAAVVLATDVVRAGGVIPSDIAEQVLMPAVRLQARSIYDAVRDAVQDNLRNDIRRTFISGVDAGLSVLRSQLEGLVADVRPLARTLDGADSSAEATERGAAAIAGWAQLEIHVLRYEQIRDAQGRLVRRYFRELGREAPHVDLTAMNGYYRDSIDVLDEWLQRRHFQASRSSMNSPAASAYVAWLNDGTVERFIVSRIAPWFPTTNPAMHLVWLATEGQPWLPAIGELVDAYTAARAALTSVDFVVGIEQYTARAEYYSVTGAVDRHKGMAREINPLSPDRIVATPDTFQSRLVTRTR